MKRFLFSEENAIAVVRTVATYAYAWIATNLPGVTDLLMDINLDPAGFIVIAGTALYQAVRVLAEKWSWVGYVLIINQKPEYLSTEE